ncbi:MAG: hypothetical protein V4471_02635 [Pseudomonadota bacterium]
MATVMKFDTLSWAKKLEKAGVPSQQAEVQVELVFQAVDDNTSTKQDLCKAEGRIEVKLKEIELSIKEVEANLELKIKQVELSLKEVESKLELSLKEVESKLELSLKEVKSKLELTIEEVESRLELKIEALRREVMLTIEKVKGAINTQIAKWVLGVSAIQTTVLVYFMRTLH